MTAPTGLLEWGQAGTYNARDDRMVIHALANGKPGIVKAATFTAGSGLTMTVGAFSTIVDCGDGTFTVAASTTSQPVTLLAGPTSGSRTDIIWLDVDPDGAAWSINVRTQADTVGRLGVKLGQVVMPQNSNLATQATLSPSAVSWLPWPQPVTMANASLVRTTTGTIATSTNYPVGWSSEETGAAAALWNVNGFVVPAAGIYQVSGRGLWATHTVGFRAASVLKNGVLQMYSETRISASAAAATYSGSILNAYLVKCIAGDVLNMQVYQNSGVTLTLIQAQMSVSQQA